MRRPSKKARKRERREAARLGFTVEGFRAWKAEGTSYSRYRAWKARQDPAHEGKAGR